MKCLPQSKKKYKLKGKSYELKSTVVLPVTLGTFDCFSGVCPQRAGGFDECVAWWSGARSERQQPGHLSLQTAGQCLFLFFNFQIKINLKIYIKNEKCLFFFLQVSMPSYLIAIVVGALESRWSFSCCSSHHLLSFFLSCLYLHMTTNFTYSVFSI